MALPVSLAEAKQHLRVTGDAQDAEITRSIADAAAWVERYTGHILEARDVEEHFSGIHAPQLRAWPIAADASLVVDYVNAAGDTVTIPGPLLDVTSRPARVRPPNRCFWPLPSHRTAYRVAFRAGYESPEDVPGNLRRAMLVMISAFDSDREGGEIFQAAEKSARSLCSDYRKRRL